MTASGYVVCRLEAASKAARLSSGVSECSSLRRSTVDADLDAAESSLEMPPLGGADGCCSRLHPFHHERLEYCTKTYIAYRRHCIQC